MSSRALRKLQREKEQKQQNADLESAVSQDESEDDGADIQTTKPKFNAFDLLDEADQDGDQESPASEEDNEKDKNTVADTATVASSKLSKSKKKKKKKKASKSAGPGGPTRASGAGKPSNNARMDEIDRALKELSVPDNLVEAQYLKPSSISYDNGYPEQLFPLLSVDTKNLNPINEMKKLFGNIVVESSRDRSSGTPTRRERGPQQLDLGTALTGRFSPASKGKDLAGVALRRNPLMQQQDEWPRATAGGLGMEISEKHSNGAITYRMVHNNAYQDVQRQFDMCVDSMEPERLIQLLQYNPYHISTLLQVSEIAKHQGDHSVSGDLLERALFSIGRSAHSSFGTALREGRARMDFNIAENREVGLAIWRYTTSLGIRGTWRTAYEWAKFLLSLGYEDYYDVKLIIDQLAIRGRQYEHFIQLFKSPFFDPKWKYLVNMHASVSLAYLRIGDAKESRAELREAMDLHRFAFSRLAQELNLEPVPRAIWGRQSGTERDRLHGELYATRAKDLWNTPESTSLLAEVAKTLDPEKHDIQGIEIISMREARHVILSEIPSLISLLPRKYTTMRTSASDPLPPEAPTPRDSDILARPAPNNDNAEPNAAPSWLETLLNFLNRDLPEDAERITPGDHISHADIERYFDAQRTDRDDDTDSDLPDLIDDGAHPPAPRLLPEDERLEQPLPETAHAEHRNRDDDSDEEESSQSMTEMNQRWLASRGLQDLRDFISLNGVDEGNWTENIDRSPLVDYATRARLVHPRARRDFFVNHVLQQGTSSMVRDLVAEEIERQEATGRH